MKLIVQLGPDKGSKRALLLASTAEIVDCNLGRQSYNYDKGTFTGEIQLRDVQFLKVTPELMEEVLKSDFDSFPAALTIKDALETNIPLLKELADANKLTQELLSSRIDKLIETQKLRPSMTKLPLSKSPEFELVEVEPNVHEVVTVEKEEATSTKQESVKESDKRKEKVNNAPSNVKEGGAPNHKGKKNKKNRKNKSKGNNEKITPDNLKEHVFGGNKQNKQSSSITEQKEKKGAQTASAFKKKVETTNQPPFAKTTFEEHKDGFFIGHIIQSKEREEQVIIITTPMEEDKIELALPMIFSNRSTANVMFDALQRHPRHQKTLGQCIVRPISEIDSTYYESDAALIVNAVTYVNMLEETE